MSVRYDPTSKEPDVLNLPDKLATNQMAYYIYARKIYDSFDSTERITMNDIFERVGEKLGLSRDESNHLVKMAVAQGFLKRGSLQPVRPIQDIPINKALTTLGHDVIKKK